MTKRKSFIENIHRIYLEDDGSKAFQGFEINKTLFSKRSPYQKIAIYSNDTLGNVLVLDGIVQITTKDEFIYQEMMAHVPLFSHPNPKKILIIGGGDGGVLKQVLRHSTVEKVTMVEIDQMVIDSCIEYMPSINDAGSVYDDPRVNLVITDASEYIKNTSERFDIVIVDSTDPVGPGEKLFTPDFYKNLSDILSEEAYISTQSGIAFFQPTEIVETLDGLKNCGLGTSCYITSVPTYYGGYMTMGFASTHSEILLPTMEELKEKYTKEKIKTKHYSPEIHLASFVLPPWILVGAND